MRNNSQSWPVGMTPVSCCFSWAPTHVISCSSELDMSEWSFVALRHCQTDTRHAKTKDIQTSPPERCKQMAKPTSKTSNLRIGGLNLLEASIDRHMHIYIYIYCFYVSYFFSSPVPFSALVFLYIYDRFCQQSLHNLMHGLSTMKLLLGRSFRCSVG